MNVLKDIINRVKTRKAVAQKKCYEENGNKDGTCYGLYGGDRYTEFLQYSCIGCKYWRCCIGDIARMDGDTE